MVLMKPIELFSRTTLPLGEDVILSIIAFLDIGDILSLRQVRSPLLRSFECRVDLGGCISFSQTRSAKC